MRRHRRTLHLLTILLTVAVALVLGEVLIWLASPTEYMYPRYQFSPEYGLLPFANVRMVHGTPRRYRFHYTTNDFHCRGETPPPGTTTPPVAVTLGDSYAFGMGVNDGEEFPAVMRRRLAGTCDVINLGSPGWGLTQQVRRFVEFGEQYDPAFVVLQFCANDPGDNLANRVTMVKDGDLVFMESANSLNWIKKYLSRAFIQRTQTYNFVRARASRVVLERLVRQEEAQLAPAAVTGGDGPSPIEQVYIDMLEAFAMRLERSGRTLYMISVDNQLDQFPGIRAAVADMDARGLLHYIEVLDWLNGMPPYRSPEGHVWGAPAHAVIGENLAGVIEHALAETDSTGTP